MTKNQIRQNIKQNFSKISQKNKQVLNQLVISKLLNAPEFINSTIIFSYMALPDELDLSKINNECLLQNKKLALPKVISQQKGQMDFYYAQTNSHQQIITTKGAYGIEEPVLMQENKIDLENLSGEKILVLVPGRAFTNNGDRLGRGKGFYDRFLARIKDNSDFTIAGVCFPFQIVDYIPTEETDIKINKLFY